MEKYHENKWCFAVKIRHFLKVVKIQAFSLNTRRRIIVRLVLLINQQEGSHLYG